MITVIIRIVPSFYKSPWLNKKGKWFFDYILPVFRFSLKDLQYIANPLKKVETLVTRSGDKTAKPEYVSEFLLDLFCSIFDK